MTSEDTSDRFASKIEVGKSVQQLYHVIQKRSGAVGGYGHNGPVYGEITMGTFQKVLNFLRDNLDFDANSAFLDIGSGLGKPNLHVALNPGVRMSFGLEVEHLRWQLSMHNLRFAIKDVPNFPSQVVHFTQRDVTDIQNFAPFTHVYMFDVGFPPSALKAIARAFNASPTVQALVSFQRPAHVIGGHGFAVECVGQIMTRMHGSSEGHTAYIYRPLNLASIPKLPPRVALPEAAEQPACSFSSLRSRDLPIDKLQQLEKDTGVATTTGLPETSSPQKRKRPISELPGSPRSPPILPKKSRRQKDSSLPSWFASPAPREDKVLKAGLDILMDPLAYTQWVDSSGLMGLPGEERVKRSAKRVLFSAQ